MSRTISTAQPELILGSSSPYRRELLARLGLSFSVESPKIDETPLAGETPPETALRLALKKACHIAQSYPNALIIGADQVATVNGEQIGKAGGFDKALAQLQMMRGQTALFHSALCLYDARDDSYQLENIVTQATFRNLPDEELAAYLRIEQPYDCAGSAKVEALGITILEKVLSDDPTALVGLPLIALTTMLRQTGVALYPSTPSIE